MPTNKDWLMKFIIGVETTVIISMLTFGIGILPSLATIDWVKEYVVEKPPILAEYPTLLRDVETNTKDIQANLRQIQILNDKTSKKLEEMNLRLFRIELALGVAKNGTTPASTHLGSKSN